jgi:hypothetical protein
MRRFLPIWVLRVASELVRGYMASDGSESPLSLPLVKMASACWRQCLSALKARSSASARYLWRSSGDHTDFFVLGDPGSLTQGSHFGVWGLWL